VKKKSLPELKEMLERQEKLLANGKLVAKLPDRSCILFCTVFLSGHATECSNPYVLVSRIC
jgi:hypothetical protein